MAVWQRRASRCGVLTSGSVAHGRPGRGVVLPGTASPRAGAWAGEKDGGAGGRPGMPAPRGGRVPQTRPDCASGRRRVGRTPPPAANRTRLGAILDATPTGGAPETPERVVLVARPRGLGGMFDARVSPVSNMPPNRTTSVARPARAGALPLAGGLHEGREDLSARLVHPVGELRVPLHRPEEARGGAPDGLDHAVGRLGHDRKARGHVA